MFRRFARILLPLMAILAMMPGFGEAVEHLAELLEHGHAAHTVVGEHDPLAAEHGCTPIQHQCPCHEAPPSSLVQRLAATQQAPMWLLWAEGPARAPQPGGKAWSPHADFPLSSRAIAPPTPPPNA